MAPLYVFLICLSGMVVGGISFMFCCCIGNYKSTESRKNHSQKSNHKEDRDKNNDVEKGASILDDHDEHDEHDEHDHKEHEEGGEHDRNSEHRKEEDSASVHSNIGAAMAAAAISANLVGSMPPSGSEKRPSKELDKEIDLLFTISEKEEKREESKSVHFGEDEPKHKEEDHKHSGGYGGFLDAGNHRDDYDGDNSHQNVTSNFD